ncbi:MAG: DUF7402 domain-containing protein, partial [Thermoleophilia bacterium]
MSVAQRIAKSAVLIAVAFLLATTAAPAAEPRPGAAPVVPPPRNGEAAVAFIGDRLPSVAAAHRVTPEVLRARLLNDLSLYVDGNSRLFYVETGLDAAASPPAAFAAPSAAEAAAPLSETFLLHSRPGANRTIYLDFDGHYLTGTAWNRDFTHNQPVSGPAWTLDGDASTFNDAERTAIQQVWQRVAEDYAPFDVDVTTEYPGEAALTRDSSQDQVYGMRVLVSPIAASIAPNSGGIAYVGVFDLVGGDYYQPALVFPENLLNSEKPIGEAATHEAGHTLGLFHDGVTNVTGYYQGHGSGETGWAPIMGSGYYRNLTQWSKGEYTGADNTENDLARMLLFGIANRPDDVGNDAGSATPLPAGPTPQTTGLIGSTGDADVFSVISGPGTLTVSATVAPLGSNLDIALELRDQAGSLLAAGNPADLLGASASASVSTGTYYVTVRGTGKPTPPASGYTDYASLGAYTLTASVPPVITHTVTPSAGSYGSISPATPQVVEAGSTVAFSMTPDPGCYLEDVLVDGVSVGTPTTYQFTQVAADHSIEAVFAPDYPTAADSVLVFVAHPDDEALTAAGILERAMAAGAPVKVVVVTNGDHKGVESGFVRQAESLAALAVLGIPESDVIFLGYPGIVAGGGLRTIYSNYLDPAGAVYVSPITGRSTTYGNRGLGGRDFHSYWTGERGDYRSDQILADVEEVLRRYRPTKIYTHASIDEHSDHRLTYRYLVDALAAAQAEDPSVRPDVYAAVIHNPTYYPYTDLWAPTDFTSGLPANFWKNTVWPEPTETGSPTTYSDQILRFTPTVALTPPPDLPATALPWAARVSIPVPSDMQTTDTAANLKFRMIDAHVSQRVSFNYAFGKSDEVFWKHPWSRNIALAATVTASSANEAAFQLPRNVVDGVVDGAPAGTQAEWVAGNGGGVGETLTLTWPRTYHITSVRLFDRPLLGKQVTAAQLSFGDGTVLSVGPLPDDALTPLEVVLPTPVDASSLTITITGFTDTVGGGGAGFAEVEVYGDPVGAADTRSPVFVSGPLVDTGRYYTSADGELALTATAIDPDGSALTYTWEAVHGTIVGSGEQVTYRAPSTNDVGDLVTVSASDGVDPPTEATLAIDVLQGAPNGLPALQDTGPDGLVAVEAEFYDATVPGGDPSWAAGIHAWTGDPTPGYSGAGALMARPNSGDLVRFAPIETRSPRLDYQVRFQTSGTHYVWIRGLGDTTNDRTVHVGLNGVVQPASDHIQGFSGNWGWSRATLDGPVATIQIPAPGIYTVNVFMREDGFKVDKLVLTTSDAYVPSGVGPAASPRVLPQAETPTITPNGGSFEGSVEVTLASTTPEAVIHYTLDGSDPTLDSPVYGGPFSLTASATVKALAEATGYRPSGVASAGFTVVPYPQPTVTSPNTALQWLQGTFHPVTWTIPTATSAGSFQVYLQTSG